METPQEFKEFRSPLQVLLEDWYINVLNVQLDSNGELWKGYLYQFLQSMKTNNYPLYELQFNACACGGGSLFMKYVPIHPITMIDEITYIDIVITKISKNISIHKFKSNNEVNTVISAQFSNLEGFVNFLNQNVRQK